MRTTVISTSLPGGADAAKQLRARAARLEREGDLAGAFEAYEQAAALAPEDPALLSALAELASQLGMHDQAAALWGHLMRADPGGAAPALGFARALTAAGRFTDAMELLKSTLQVHPQAAPLWSALGLTLTYAGRSAEALTFFDEALRLDPRSSTAAHNRGLAWCDLGRAAEAEADFLAAGKLTRDPSDRAAIEFSLALLALGRGNLAEGWRLYERRLSPDWPKHVTFQAPGRRLRPGDALAGRSVLVLAEQGVGDEIMFASLLPDLVQELGPKGRLTLAVDARLGELFVRSFPTAQVCAHATERAGARSRRRPAAPLSGAVELWIPLASLGQRYRRGAADFPRTAYLHPAPERVRRWRDWLGPQPAVGISWRSGKLTGERRRFYPALSDWTGLLQTPGAQFVNLQYGDCEEDLAALAELSGVEIRRPPGLDIKDDLDDLAALCVALDAVVSVQNATAQLAGAVGAKVAFVSGPASWTLLGWDRPPWYASGHLCTTDSLADWRPALIAAQQMIAAT